MSGQPEEFDFSMLGPGADHFALARTMVSEGAMFPSIVEKLQNAGLRPEFTWRVICTVAGELVENRVIARVSDDVLRHELVGRGLRDQEADNVIETMRQKHHRSLRRQGLHVGELAVIGAVLITVGMLVGLGNVTGVLPTLSGLGRALVVLGAIAGGASFVWRK